MKIPVVEVARAPVAGVAGRWYRQLPARWAPDALVGRVSAGRWSTGVGYPTLYLASTVDSAVIELYRHSIDNQLDDAVALAGEIKFGARALITSEVSVTDIVDLRSAVARAEVDLPLDVLTCDPHDRVGYLRCQAVASAAHQLGRHGVIAPAATLAGETLVVFTDLLSPEEAPRQVADVLWRTLPADPRVSAPRRLRAVDISG